MGAKYKPKDYEVLRRRCVALWQEGLKHKAIAAALGITQGGVSRTLTKFKQQGEAALQYHKPTGAPPRLTQEQLTQLVEELSKGPQHHGFAGEIWTRKRVKAVIEQLFAVSYDESQVGRILKKVGWSRQKPQKKAQQQKPEAVRQWQDERLPELKKVHQEKRVILYIDEAACYLLPFLAHTWAPGGQTPVIQEKAGREHWNLIGAIASNGRIYVGYQNQAYTGEDLVWFLEKLCSRYRKRNLLVIWQGRLCGWAESPQ